MSEEVIKCSFCEKDQHEVSCVIAGPKCFICNQCVICCMGIILIGMDENEAYATLDDMKENAIYWWEMSREHIGP